MVIIRTHSVARLSPGSGGRCTRHHADLKGTRDCSHCYCPYLLLAGELHLSLRDLAAEMVHLTTQLNYLIIGARSLIELFGQVEVLVVELSVVLCQLV